MSDNGRIYIAEMASILGRAEHTIRQWLKREDFPASLKPDQEGGRNKLFWTSSQTNGMRDYAAERDAARGSWGRITT